MTLKNFITSLILCVYCINAFSQNEIPTIDKIVFNDGTIREGKLKLNKSQGIEFNGNVKLCNGKKNKDCISYQISDIANITQAPPELIVNQLKELKTSKAYHNILEKSDNPDEFKIETYINHYKVIYNDNEENGGLAKLKYSGKNADFYYYSKPGKNGGKTCLTKPNSNSIIFSYNSTGTSDKFSLKQLSEYFKNCEIFTKKSTEKNAHKTYKIKYFYKLSDKCSI
ncbi:hypothetical protein [Psychroserpens damuponensis]|uniref:hypothetical protein n=1 Tax=Psychroserpens damuponensis TaxID=943936 RepID=UPI0005911A39|nr:hypothetical protein [Psychroserpens damuponensis]